jgi:phosphohistidine phosphatase
MSRIYLLRHGIAVPHGTPGVADDERPLTAKGERRVGQVARGLRRLGVEPDRLLTSPLPRARRTAEIVAAELDIEDRVEDAPILRPGNPAEAIRDWLCTQIDADVMLVGHNPNLTDLVGVLLGLPPGSFPFELKKGGVAALRSEADGTARLQWAAPPGLIRALAR